MNKETKHLVLVTMKEDHGERQKIFWGRFHSDGGTIGKRRIMYIEPVSTSKKNYEKGIDEPGNVFELVFDNPIPIRYLPKERRDLHKEILTFPGRAAVTLLDNGIINKDNIEDDIEKKILLRQRDRLVKNIEELLDFMDIRGIYQLPDAERMRIKQEINDMRRVSDEYQKSPIVRREEETK